LNSINTLIQQGIEHQAFDSCGGKIPQPGLRQFHVRGGGGEVQRRGPVPAQFLEQLTAPGERDAPDVLPGNGEYIEGHKRRGQLFDQARQGDPGSDHALLQCLEVQPVPIPDDGFAVQDDTGRHLVRESCSYIYQDFR
jgi:hypothetical protein